MIERRGIIVYFETKEALDQLNKQVVNIYYVSEKNKYAIIYCDYNQYKPLCNQLSNTPGITGYEDSLLEVEKNSF